VVHEHVPESGRPAVDAHPVLPQLLPAEEVTAVESPEVIGGAKRSPSRPGVRRQSAWRRQTPRPSVEVARISPTAIPVPETRTFLARADVRVAIVTAAAVVALMVGIWIGRRESPAAPIDSAIHAQFPLSRSP
jgi:hypothetical protein